MTQLAPRSILRRPDGHKLSSRSDTDRTKVAKVVRKQIKQKVATPGHKQAAAAKPSILRTGGERSTKPKRTVGFNSSVKVRLFKDDNNGDSKHRDTETPIKLESHVACPTSTPSFSLQQQNVPQPPTRSSPASSPQASTSALPETHSTASTRPSSPAAEESGPSNAPESDISEGTTFAFSPFVDDYGDETGSDTDSTTESEEIDTADHHWSESDDEAEQVQRPQRPLPSRLRYIPQALAREAPVQEAAPVLFGDDGFDAPSPRPMRDLPRFRRRPAAQMGEGGPLRRAEGVLALDVAVTEDGGSSDKTTASPLTPVEQLPQGGQSLSSSEDNTLVEMGSAPKEDKDTEYDPEYLVSLDSDDESGPPPLDEVDCAQMNKDRKAIAAMYGLEEPEDLIPYVPEPVLPVESDSSSQTGDEVDTAELLNQLKEGIDAMTSEQRNSMGIGEKLYNIATWAEAGRMAEQNPAAATGVPAGVATTAGSAEVGMAAPPSLANTVAAPPAPLPPVAPAESLPAVAIEVTASPDPTHLFTFVAPRYVTPGLLPENFTPTWTSLSPADFGFNAVIPSQSQVGLVAQEVDSEMAPPQEMQSISSPPSFDWESVEPMRKGDQEIFGSYMNDGLSLPVNSGNLFAQEAVTIPPQAPFPSPTGMQYPASTSMTDIDINMLPNEYESNFEPWYPSNAGVDINSTSVSTGQSTEQPQAGHNGMFGNLPQIMVHVARDPNPDAVVAPQMAMSAASMPSSADSNMPQSIESTEADVMDEVDEVPVAVPQSATTEEPLRLVALYGEPEPEHKGDHSEQESMREPELRQVVDVHEESEEPGSANEPVAPPVAIAAVEAHLEQAQEEDRVKKDELVTPDVASPAVQTGSKVAPRDMSDEDLLRWFMAESDRDPPASREQTQADVPPPTPLHIDEPVTVERLVVGEAQSALAQTVRLQVSDLLPTIPSRLATPPPRAAVHQPARAMPAINTPLAPLFAPIPIPTTFHEHIAQMRHKTNPEPHPLTGAPGRHIAMSVATSSMALQEARAETAAAAAERLQKRKLCASGRFEAPLAIAEDIGCIAGGMKPRASVAQRRGVRRSDEEDSYARRIPSKRPVLVEHHALSSPPPRQQYREEYTQNGIPVAQKPSVDSNGRRRSPQGSERSSRASSRDPHDRSHGSPRDPYERTRALSPEPIPHAESESDKLDLSELAGSVLTTSAGMMTSGMLLLGKSLSRALFGSWSAKATG